MTRTKHRILTLGALVALSASASRTAFAWGERGHHTLCEVATRLVKTRELQTLLHSKGHMMGHVCNVPDILWRNLPKKSVYGDNAHFLNPENLDVAIQDLPTSLPLILRQYQGKLSHRLNRPLDVGLDLGTMWWRAEQFYNNGVEAGKRVAKAGLVKAEERDATKESFPTLTKDATEATLDMIKAFGILGHFVGDASQPYHNNSNYDGWDDGHGGIHSYYESQVVDALPLSLAQDVYDEAMKNPFQFKATDRTVPDKMKSLSVEASAELEKVNELDKFIKPSTSTTDSKGVQFKVKAERRPARETAPTFKPLVVKELARAASALAQFWDLAYAEAGRPPVQYYFSYIYPNTVDFVEPTYIQAALKEAGLEAGESPARRP